MIKLALEIEVLGIHESPQGWFNKYFEKAFICSSGFLEPSRGESIHEYIALVGDISFKKKDLKA